MNTTKNKKAIEYGELDELLEQGKFEEAITLQTRKVKWLFNNANKNTNVVDEKLVRLIVHKLRQTESIYEMVEKRRPASAIIEKAGYRIEDVKNHTFESASFVFGLKDNKSLIEICFAPEMINKWKEKNNPLFKN